MEVIYEKGVTVVEALQYRFLDHSDALCAISNLCDPRYAYLLYCPLVFSLSWDVGKRLMWVVVMVEWTNHLLKWVLHGDRPYWWIHETDVYNRTGIPIPDLHQYPLTCETGPGSPSGHSQMTAAVWFVIVSSFLQKYNSNPEKRSNLITTICWLSYLVLLVAIAVSRVFIAAHFPHQCLFGVILGCMVSLALRNIDKRQFTSLHYCYVTAGMFFSAVIVYEYLKVIGSDPVWTMDRAVKWCVKPEYIHLDTTPFFSMSRYCGYLFGMGFGFNSGSHQRLCGLKFGASARIVCACASVGICLLSEMITLPKDNATLFYLQAFALNVILSYITIAIVPKYVALMWDSKEKVS